MRFFNADSKFFRFLSRLWDIIILNFFWLVTGPLAAIGGIALVQLTGIYAFYALCAISLVTIGPATVSAYTILLKMVDETEGYMVKPYFRGFKANFKQGVPLGMLAVLMILAAYTDLYVLSSQLDLVAFFVLGIFTAVLCVVILPYAFPLTARYENKLINHVKNAFRVSMKYFGRSILLWLVLAVELIIFLWNQYTQIVGLLIGPMTMMLTISGFGLPIFRKIEADGGVIVRKTEEDLYNEEIEKEVQAALKSQGLDSEDPKKEKKR